VAVVQVVVALEYQAMAALVDLVVAVLVEVVQQAQELQAQFKVLAVVVVHLMVAQVAVVLE
jgi:hypothetical protein